MFSDARTGASALGKGGFEQLVVVVTVRNEDEEILAVIVTYNTALCSTVFNEWNFFMAEFSDEEKPYDLPSVPYAFFLPRSRRS